MGHCTQAGWREEAHAGWERERVRTHISSLEEVLEHLRKGEPAAADGEEAEQIHHLQLILARIRVQKRHDHRRAEEDGGWE